MPKMLDFGKYLSEQTPEVQKAWLNAVPIALEKNPKNADILSEMLTHPKGSRGNGLYSALAGMKNDKNQASDILNKLGVTGVKYKDGNANNYVVFDDQLPKILERNGQPIK
jgi:hypothetical protein